MLAFSGMTGVKTTATTGTVHETSMIAVSFCVRLEQKYTKILRKNA